MVFGFFEPDVPEIDAQEVYTALQKHEEILLIDVRTTEEYEKEHIEGSILVPMDTIDEKITQRIPEKAKRIIMYCRSGARSKVATARLMSVGYTNISSMKSGLLAWHVYRFPTIRSKNDPKKISTSE